ncbi:DUF4041 domain-containing protein [Aeromonas jandaei]|uniref:DUF4041 domain-containing protein n=1 Tax=Aeromonas jandaei TaxID=650 RepID=UPI001BB49C26|nr:DUF4041 domain-containing protein [Aeromonas jandaei]QTL93851.1 hypothetical protein AjGTCBM29_01707 [Aeromonas jandaei]
MEVFWVLLIIFFPYILAFVLYKKKQRLNVNLKHIETVLRKVQEDKDELDRKYKPITDMEIHVQRLLDDAEEQAISLRLEAERLTAQAERKMAEATTAAEIEAGKILADASALRTEARERLKAARDKAEQIEQDSRREAERTIEYANKHAQEIAGDALEAKHKADLYESTIKAMRNTIEGYKDDYIIPNQAVLDELADEYSHKEAGEQLKIARKRMRDLVKNGYAGDCDYVEPSRKAYAIHFAVDAFNGKVDSALSKVKHDNYGKIKQEILDAFALVNHNGAPFRNARIRQEFLDARLDELKWAVTTYELQQQEREEQRQIREQMREEERAQREMEKAIKEAEKEERMLQKALEKARQELASANEDQRQQFEAQLAELEAKLQEAEAKGQRAISMAQQTRRGHVYVISNIGSFGENIFKVGMTRRLEPLDRVKELSDASVPFDFDVHAMIYSDDAPSLEKDLHRAFDASSVNKVNPRKEFFNLPLSDIRKTIEGHGIHDIHWTMKAEATEYRESLSLLNKAQTTKELVTV